MFYCDLPAVVELFPSFLDTDIENSTMQCAWLG